MHLAQHRGDHDHPKQILAHPSCLLLELRRVITFGPDMPS